MQQANQTVHTVIITPSTIVNHHTRYKSTICAMSARELCHTEIHQ